MDVLPVLKKKDLVIILILGEIVGLFGYAIVSAQPELSGLFVSLVPAAVLPVLFVLGVPLVALACLVLAFVLAKKINPIFFQMGKFAAVGFSNTSIDWGVFNLILAPIGFSTEKALSIVGINVPLYSIGKAISFAVATLNSFIWNRSWSFEKKGSHGVGKEAVVFYAFTAVGFLINVVVATVIAKLGPESKLFGGVIAPACATAVSMIWNFTAYKFFVFRPAASVQKENVS